MQAIKNISFEPDLAALLQAVHLDPETAEADEFANLLKLAVAVARPKAAYRECFIKHKDHECVVIDEVTFTSRALNGNLGQAKRVFPFVVTCGAELDQIDLPNRDFLTDFWWDAIKNAALQAARSHLKTHFAQNFALIKTTTMSPGAGDAEVWPIEQQRQLFALLGDVTKHIGVKLTESCLMMPNKTVSGIRYPTEVDFRSCQLCHRDPCPGRAASFDQELWDHSKQ